MKLDVPAKVRYAIKDADMRRFAETTRKIRAREKEDRRLGKIADLRNRRRIELTECAMFVFEWRNAFTSTEEYRRICELIGDQTRLPIYGARFWKGEPTDDRHAWATLSFEEWTAGAPGFPPLHYEERYNAAQGSHLAVDARIIESYKLTDTVHPDFLAGLAAHLRGPDPWKYVIQTIERLNPQPT